MHILSPETDNCPSWISGRERMTVENISWSISTKECCRPRRGLNPRPPGLQSDGASNWATEAGENKEEEEEKKKKETIRKKFFFFFFLLLLLLFFQAWQRTALSSFRKGKKYFSRKSEFFKNRLKTLWLWGKIKSDDHCILWGTFTRNGLDFTFLPTF